MNKNQNENSSIEENGCGLRVLIDDMMDVLWYLVWRTLREICIY